MSGSTVIDYLEWRGDLSFDVAPFNEVDAAILTLMVYLPLDQVVGRTFSDKKATTAKICEECGPWKMLLMDLTELKEEVSKSERFAKIKFSKFVNNLDDEKRKQFAAVCVTLPNKTEVVVFRGTDETITGWKENVDLATSMELPGQKDAVKYVNEVGKHAEGDLIICGHSKGGNLAIYSAAFCKSEISERILQVYNLDGPGFNGDAIKPIRATKIGKKVKTFIPQSSLIGILMQQVSKAKIVNSFKGNGISEHLPLSWETSAKSFVYRDKMTFMGEQVSVILNKWIQKLTPDQKKDFIRVLFGVFEDAGISTVDDFSDIKNLHEMIKVYKNLDETEKSCIEGAVDELQEVTGNKIRSGAKNIKNDLKNKMTQMFNF